MTIKVIDYKGREYTVSLDDIIATQEKDGKYYIGIWNKTVYAIGLAFSIDKEGYEQIKSLKEKK